MEEYKKLCDYSGVESSEEFKLFYDSFSDRFFEARLSDVLKAQQAINLLFLDQGYATVQDFYSRIPVLSDQFAIDPKYANRNIDFINWEEPITVDISEHPWPKETDVEIYFIKFNLVDPIIQLITMRDFDY